MRNDSTKVLKEFFCDRLVKTKEARNSTHAQMAKRLNMTERSYINLDHGKSSCSALTLAYYLIYCCEDPMAFLEDLKKKLEEVANVIA